MAAISGVVNKLTAADTPTADGTGMGGRWAPYGELYVVEMMDDGDAQAMSGVRYQARPTPAVGGTGIAMGIQVTFSDTANIPWILVNSNGNKRIIMEYIKFRVTAAGTTSTSCEAAIEIDATNRYSSGGTDQTATIKSCTTEDNTATSVTTLRTGAVTAAAAGANRKWLWSELIRKAAAPMWIVNDTVIFKFGNFDGLPVASSAVSATDAAGTHFTYNVPPAVIGAGGSILLHIANIANASTPPSLEFEAGWKEY